MSISSKIILTNSSAASAVPSADDLSYGELAINYRDGKLFFKDVNDNIVNIASSSSETSLASHLGTSNPHNITKTTIGLSNVDNTSDLNKPISTLTQSALNQKSDVDDTNDLISLTGVSSNSTDLGTFSGSTINDSSTIKVALQALETKVELVDADTNLINNHISDTSNPHLVTKDQVGLSFVDNTSDLNKPVSTATQSALNQKTDVGVTNNLISLTGVSSNSTNLGLFGGTIIEDNSTIKNALQALETKVELVDDEVLQQLSVITSTEGDGTLSYSNGEFIYNPPTLDGLGLNLSVNPEFDSAGALTYSNGLFTYSPPTLLGLGIGPIQSKIDNLQALSGVSNETNLGEFSGNIISDNATIKTALHQLEIAMVSNVSNIGDLESLSGVSGNANLGAFSDIGELTSPLTDNGTIKSTFQEISDIIAVNIDQVTGFLGADYANEESPLDTESSTVIDAINELHEIETDIVGKTNAESMALQPAFSVDIDGGNIDATTIGATTPAAGTFTSVNIDSIAIDNNVIASTNIDGDININPNGAGVTQVTGQLNTDTIKVNGGGVVDLFNHFSHVVNGADSPNVTINNSETLVISNIPATGVSPGDFVFTKTPNFVASSGSSDDLISTAEAGTDVINLKIHNVHHTNDVVINTDVTWKFLVISFAS